jgi:hypothetical protein
VNQAVIVDTGKRVKDREYEIETYGKGHFLIRSVKIVVVSPDEGPQAAAFEKRQHKVATVIAFAVSEKANDVRMVKRGEHGGLSLCGIVRRFVGIDHIREDFHGDLSGQALLKPGEYDTPRAPADLPYQADAFDPMADAGGDELVEMGFHKALHALIAIAAISSLFTLKTIPPFAFSLHTEKNEWRIS